MIITINSHHFLAQPQPTGLSTEAGRNTDSFESPILRVSPVSIIRLVTRSRLHFNNTPITMTSELKKIENPQQSNVPSDTGDHQKHAQFHCHVV